MDQSRCVSIETDAPDEPLDVAPDCVLPMGRRGVLALRLPR
jgi:hypothetical protein